MSITRRATPTDIPLLTEMMREFYAETNYPLDGAWATASFGSLLRNESYGAVWFGFCGGEPAGYVVLTTRFSMEHGGLEACIDDLFVRPAYRRRGVGHALLNALSAECKRRNISALHAEAAHDNIAAKALYTSHGLHLQDDGRQTFTSQIAGS